MKRLSEAKMDILRQLQEHFAKIAPGVSLADELIAERREEALIKGLNLDTPSPLKKGKR